VIFNYFQKKDFAWFVCKRLLYLRYQRKETKPMTLSKKLTLSLASMAVLGLLAACSNQKAQTPESSASTQQSSSKVSSSQSSEVSKQTEGLDGTYKGTDENDRITLTISGNTGTWEEDEADGEKESKSVTVNPDNQSLTIGDDTKFYKLDGNQLTIEDDDHDPNDTVVLTK